MFGALRGVPAKGVGAYLLANSAAGGVAPSQKKQSAIYQAQELWTNNRTSSFIVQLTGDHR